MKRLLSGVAVMLLSAAVLTAGCATGKDKGSAPGGGKRDTGRDTFSRTGTGMSGDVEYGRGMGSSTGIGTMGSGAGTPGETGSGTGGAAGAPYRSYTSGTR